MLCNENKYSTTSKMVTYFKHGNILTNCAGHCKINSMNEIKSVSYVIKTSLKKIKSARISIF